MTDELERALREGGEKVADGRFKVDSRRALAKLKDYRFADPAHWVLEVLRAASASGARTVSVRTDADDVELHFDGRPFPQAMMKDLLQHALHAGGNDDEKRARLLALGVSGALGLSPAFVRVASGGVALEYDGEGEVVAAPSSAKGTSLHVRKRFGWRVATAFLRGSPEAAAIAATCRRFGARLSLNGREVNRTQPFDVSLVHERRVLLKGGALVVGVPVGELLGETTVDLDVHGVLVGQRTVRLPGLQCLAWLRGDALQRNASGSDVVETDATLLTARGELRAVSLGLLRDAVTALKAGGDDATRQHFVRLLLDDTLEDGARAILADAPVLPGPAGEWHAIAELQKEVEDGQPVRTATMPYPKGTYPSPAVFLPPGSELAALLPGKRREDVAKYVEARRRAAENQARWESSPQEEARLSGGSWLARAPLEESGLSGEVGLSLRGREAFVRVLHQGRLVQQGDLPQLAPLRLRAAVDVRRALPAGTWQELPNKRLWTLVADAVEAGAERALLAALDAPDAFSTDDVAGHAKDLLSRATRLAKRGFKDLPAKLRDAPLFACLGGERVSLRTLEGEPRWRFVTSRWPHGLLSGERVLLFEARDEEILRALGNQRLAPAVEQLVQEDEIRRRLSGPKQAPIVEPRVLAVPVQLEGLRGEVVVPAVVGNRLDLTVLRDGFLLERTELTPRYALAAAAVDCPALTPDATWTKAERDTVFEQVVNAVREGERLLAKEAAKLKLTWGRMPPSLRKFLRAFIEKELTPLDVPHLDGVQRAVAEARLFDGPNGALSLLEALDGTQAAGRLWTVPDGARVDVPEALVAVRDVEGAADLVAAAVGARAENLLPELARLEARRRFEARPEQKYELPASVAARATATEGPTRCHLGLASGLDPSALVRVLVKKRLFESERYPAHLPLTAVVEDDTVDPAEPMPAATRERLQRVLRVAERQLLEQNLDALAAAGDAEARRVALLALGTHLDAAVPDALGARLRTCRLFPCTDGQVRSAAELDTALGVLVCTERLDGAPRSGRPVVLVLEPLVRAGLRRWKSTEDVTQELRRELEARRRHQQTAARATIAVPDDTRLRRRVTDGVMEGEVALVTGPLAGALELLHERRPLCTIQGALPLPFAAVVSCDALTPAPDYSGVARDAAYEKVVSQVLAEGAGLAERAGVVFADRGVQALSLEEQLLATQLAMWAGAQVAWAVPAKKKRKGKRKGKRGAAPEAADAASPVAGAFPALLKLPVLARTDGRPLTVGELLEAKAAGRPVRHSHLEGRFLQAEEWAWRPRPGELALAAPLKLTLEDASETLRHATRVLSQAATERVQVPLTTPWREKVAGPGLEGEVALLPLPSGRLEVEVFHQRVPLETHAADHPAGAHARVDGAALAPNASWTKAGRNQAFRELMAAVEAALERLLARRLSEGPKDDGWRAWALAAAQWRPASAGPLGPVVPLLPLFESLDGSPVTVGAVRALQATERFVAVAERGLRAAGGRVLVDTAEARAALKVLGLPVESVTAALRRDAALQEERLKRRLHTLTWTGDALVRVEVATDTLRGELALAAAPDAEVSLVLAKEGIRVAGCDEVEKYAVAGVLDVKDLAVNDDWTRATLTGAQKAAIQEQVDLLFGALERATAGFGAGKRAAAAEHVLRYLGRAGVTAPSHLDRLGGVAAALQGASVFRTVDGRWVSLRAVADEVLARGQVAVLPRSFFSPDVGDALVLEAATLDAPWVRQLGAVLGAGNVARVEDAAAWREARAEADPLEGTPELSGLRALRREVKLLRAGALGQLTPDELEDVKLRRSAGKVAVTYDARRKVALLDPSHAGVARALAQAGARPERVFVLLAAVFGAVNRALERVTDAHEAELLLALAGHLAANPRRLDPRAKDVAE